MKTLLRRTGAAVATSALVIGGAVATASSASADSMPPAKDTVNYKVTCKKGAVRSKPYGKGSVRGHVYQSTKDWGHITHSALGGKDRTIKYWYGTWHHGKKSAKGWVTLSCASPYEQ